MNLRESARYDQVRAGKLLGGGGTVTLDGWEEREWTLVEISKVSSLFTLLLGFFRCCTAGSSDWGRSG